MSSNSLHNVRVKLLAFDLNSLTQSHSLSSSDPISFYRKGVQVSRVEVLGVVVTRDLKPGKFMRFSIDDGTGCVQCILWLNQLTSPYFSRRCPSDVRAIAQMALVHSGRVQLGHVARVRGRITSFRGSVQITVDDVVVERDPNSEILHWLQCVSLARKRYDVLAANVRFIWEVFGYRKLDIKLTLRRYPKRQHMAEVELGSILQVCYCILSPVLKHNWWF